VRDLSLSHLSNYRNGTDINHECGVIMNDKLYLNGDAVTSMFYDNKPQLVWEMDQNTYLHIRKLKYADGEYLWAPDFKFPDKKGKMLGMDITISDEPGIRLVTIFRKSEHSKLVVME